MKPITLTDEEIYQAICAYIRAKYPGTDGPLDVTITQHVKPSLEISFKVQEEPES